MQNIRILAIVFALSLFSFGSLGFAQQEASSLGSLSDKLTDLDKKIDQITQNQQQILSQLAEIRQELDTVKIRVTHR